MRLGASIRGWCSLFAHDSFLYSRSAHEQVLSLSHTSRICLKSRMCTGSIEPITACHKVFPLENTSLTPFPVIFPAACVPCLNACLATLSTWARVPWRLHVQARSIGALTGHEPRLKVRLSCYAFTRARVPSVLLSCADTSCLHVQAPCFTPDARCPRPSCLRPCRDRPRP